MLSNDHQLEGVPAALVVDVVLLGVAAVAVAAAAAVAAVVAVAAAVAVVVNILRNGFYPCILVFITALSLVWVGY